jgi:hypothetical protein
MWEDGDGSIFCGSCGWEVGTVIDNYPEFDNYPEYAKNLRGIF